MISVRVGSDHRATVRSKNLSSVNQPWFSLVPSSLVSFHLLRNEIVVDLFHLCVQIDSNSHCVISSRLTSFTFARTKDIQIGSLRFFHHRTKTESSRHNCVEDENDKCSDDREEAIGKVRKTEKPEDEGGNKREIHEELNVKLDAISMKLLA